MDTFEDFKIITAPESEINEKKHKIKKSKKDSKRKLNKVLENNDQFLSKPKWDDKLDRNVVGKSFECLDISKIFKNKKEKLKNIKSCSILSKEKLLISGYLDFFRCNDANRDYPSKKYISFSVFHPKRKCIIVGDNNGSLCLFKIDGEDNDALCSPLSCHDFPIKGGDLLPDGLRCVFFSRRNYFRVIHLETSEIAEFSVEKSYNIKRLLVLPRSDYILFSSQKNIHVVSTKSFDVVQKIMVSGELHSLAFSHNGKYIYAFEAQGKVSVFEFKEDGRLIIVRKWYDDGCIEPVRICISSNDQYVACASQGNVNVYNLNDTWSSEYPKPLKSLNYPETRINQLQFNNCCDLLAIGYCLNSDRMRGAHKLLHLKTMTVFANFPGPRGNDRPTSLSFSPNDKYLAVGQFNGKIALFNIKYYEEY